MRISPLSPRKKASSKRGKITFVLSLACVCVCVLCEPGTDEEKRPLGDKKKIPTHSLMFCPAYERIYFNPLSSFARP
jgi:hypothetical protein